MKKQTVVAPKPDMMKEIKDDVFQDLTNILDDVENCFDVDEDVSREAIRKMVIEAIEKGIKDVVATLTDVTPDVDELVKDKNYVWDVLLSLAALPKGEILPDAMDTIKEIAGGCSDFVMIKTNNLADQIKVEEFVEKLYPIYADQQSNVLF